MIYIFWFAVFVVFYTYIGYGILLFVMVKFKRWFGKPLEITESYQPEVTLLVAAYNEKDYARIKVENSLGLDYPVEKLKLVWVTDGSDDGTPDILRSLDRVEVLHQNERKGKINAMNRAVKLVNSPIVVFSDANTLLPPDAIKRIVRLFSNKKVGCVSGEKRIMNQESEAAAGAGEGFYWKYESTLKRWDAELYSVVGAAGELFAIRSELFEDVEPDTLLDDFMISLRIAMKGYTTQYDPNAYAIETASANVKEEMKRKVRICAGGIQSVVRLAPLLNIFKYGILSFQYISHRVLRWTITPFCLLIALITNIILAFTNENMLYAVLLLAQLLFYAMAFIGKQLQDKPIKLKGFFVPYYFFIMNYSVFLGLRRYLKKSQSVNWERAKRA